MLAAGIVQDTFAGEAGEDEGGEEDDDRRLLLLLLLLVLLPLRLESLPFLSSWISFVKHSHTHGY